MASKLRARKVGSIDKMKKSLKKSGGDSYLKRISEGSINVRFLTEPSEWIDYSEHYDSVRNYYPCTTTDCDGCNQSLRPSSRYLANALDRDDDKVVPLVIPKTLAQSLLKKYDKYTTLLDRDYELSREGTGQNDTVYDATPEAPTRIKGLSGYETLDLMELLNAQLEDDDDSDSDDDDEVPVKSSRRAQKVAPVDNDDEDDDDDDETEEDEEPVKSAPKKAETRVDDDDDDDDEDEDDDDDTSRDRLEALGINALKRQAKEAGATVTDLKGLDKEGVIDWILDNGAEEDPEEAEMDADSDDDEEEEITEEQLGEMSLRELKALCTELDVKVPRGADKDALIELILDSGEDE